MNLLGLTQSFFKTKVGIGGFTADVQISNTVSFDSDVPDNYVEDGSYVNDHIINSPKKIEISGEIANINFKAPINKKSARDVIDRASDIMSKVIPIMKTPFGLQTVSTTSSFLPKKISNIFGFLGGVQNPQVEFFKFIENLHDSKSLIDIETPSKTYSNMRITSFSYTQDNTTSEASTYNITAKEIRFATTLTVDAKGTFSDVAKNPTKGAAKKVAPTIKRGTVSTKSTSTTLSGGKFDKNWMDR